MTNIEQFLQMVKESDNIVFFGGAGVSTESGIPDFRSVDGLYNQKYDYPPETILSHSFYIKYPEEFYRFYRDKMLCLDAEPNITHKKLAELEAAVKSKIPSENPHTPISSCNKIPHSLLHAHNPTRKNCQILLTATYCNSPVLFALNSCNWRMWVVSMSPDSFAYALSDK